MSQSSGNPWEKRGKTAPLVHHFATHPCSDSWVPLIGGCGRCSGWLPICPLREPAPKPSYQRRVPGHAPKPPGAVLLISQTKTKNNTKKNSPTLSPPHFFPSPRRSESRSAPRASLLRRRGGVRARGGLEAFGSSIGAVGSHGKAPT